MRKQIDPTKFGCIASMELRSSTPQYMLKIWCISSSWSRRKVERELWSQILLD